MESRKTSFGVLVGTVVVGGMAMFSTACASPGGSERAGSAGADSGVELEVDNRHWRDVVVFVTRGGARSRLGMVTSNSSGTFGLRREFLAGGYTVTLLVEVVGSSESLRSGPVTVFRGAVVVWRLRPVLNQSMVSVRSAGEAGEGGAFDPVTLYTDCVSHSTVL